MTDVCAPAGISWVVVSWMEVGSRELRAEPPIDMRRNLSGAKLAIVFERCIVFATLFSPCCCGTWANLVDGHKALESIDELSSLGGREALCVSGSGKGGREGRVGGRGFHKSSKHMHAQTIFQRAVHHLPSMARCCNGQIPVPILA